MCVGKSIFIFSIIICYIFAQDCGTQGEKCGSNYQCCGGCCVSGVCTEATNKGCTLVEDICEEMYCPPGFDCQVYQPNCPGCEAQRNCAPIQER